MHAPLIPESVTLVMLSGCSLVASVDRGQVAEGHDMGDGLGGYGGAPPEELVILGNGTLGADLGMGIDSSGGVRDWAFWAEDLLRMTYPANQTWGAVFITHGGDPMDFPRPSRDLSEYRRLVATMRGSAGGEMVGIGLKDDTDPDDGTETKMPVTLGLEWRTYEFALTDFTTADSSRLYVVVEFVFEGSDAETIKVKRVVYAK